MQNRVDFSDLTREVSFSREFPKTSKAQARAGVKKISKATMKNIQATMPVDTGRARASWGIFTPRMLAYISTKNPSNPDDAIWIVEDDGLTITQGTRVPYVGYLNEGSSKQAPALFIDVAAEQAADALAEDLVDRLQRVLLRQAIAARLEPDEE